MHDEKSLNPRATALLCSFARRLSPAKGYRCIALMAQFDSVCAHQKSLHEVIATPHFERLFFGL